MSGQNGLVKVDVRSNRIDAHTPKQFGPIEHRTFFAENLNLSALFRD
jgi:hypothetical protein